jgi:membrane protein DedA with SNARE-associated domain
MNHVVILGLFDWLNFEHVRSWIQSGSYAVLFGLLFACGLGLPLPEDIPLTISGILIAQHQMHFAIAAPVAWLGIIGGDCMLYTFGYKYGRNIVRVPIIGKHITLERLVHAEVLFARWGILVVAVGRLFAGIRGAMVIAAGTSRFKFPKFIVADGLAAVVSGGMFMSLGYWFGSNLDAMMHKAHEFKLALSIGGILLVGAIILYARWRNRRQMLRNAALAQKVTEIALQNPQAPTSTN